MPKEITRSDSKPSHEEIARRAQALFEQSGRVPGRDMENWLEAERQLIAARRAEPEARQEPRQQPSKPGASPPGRNHGNSAPGNRPTSTPATAHRT